MKRKLTLLFLLMISCMLVFALAACDDDEHTHEVATVTNETIEAATCTDQGSYYEVSACSCGQELSRIRRTAPAKGHAPKEAVKENETEATCLVVGTYDEVVYCSGCNSELSRDKKTVTMEHIPSEIIRENDTMYDCTVASFYYAVKRCTACNTELLRAKVSVSAASSHTTENGECRVCHIPASTEGLIFSLNEDLKSYTVTGMLPTCLATDITIGLFQNLPVTHVSSDAFCGNSQITSVTVASCVKSIPEQAFALCTGITDFTVSDINTEYKSVDGNLYTKNGKTLIQYAVASTANEITLSVGTERIAAYAFAGAVSLEKINLPKSLSSVDIGAFSGCISLSDVYFDGSQTRWSSVTVAEENEPLSAATMHYPSSDSQLPSVPLG